MQLALFHGMLWISALSCLNCVPGCAYAQSFDQSSLLQITQNVTDESGPPQSLTLEVDPVPSVPLVEWLPLDTALGVRSFIYKEYFSEWTSPRDLAILPPPHRAKWSDGTEFGLFSAIPSFGEDGNFIALLMTRDVSERQAELHEMFCSGPNRAHLTKVRVHRRSLLCAWPAEEAEKESFDVFLEDPEGNILVKVLARRKSGLVKKYHSVACVRDIFVKYEAIAESTKQMVEWMEWSNLHGIEHFFVYTFKATEDAVKDVLMPYLTAGLATRIHLDVTQGPDSEDQQFQVVRDCLYRAKNHATWVMPSVDIDEYFRLNSGNIFPDGKVPQDYLRTGWDAIAKSQGKNTSEVHSISFLRFRFARAPSGNLTISSSWREPQLQQRKGNRNQPALPKFVMNAHKVYDLWWHSVYNFDEGAPYDIRLNETFGALNHYRPALHVDHYRDTFLATIFDDKLASDSSMLEEAIRKRFGETLSNLMKRVDKTHPPKATKSPVQSN